MALSWGCGPAQVSVRGEVAGQQVASEVDSDVARYYVEHYLQGDVQNPALHERIDALTARYNSGDLSRADLENITRAFNSVDFAALFFSEMNYRNPRHHALQRTYLNELHALEEAAESAQPLASERHNVVLLFAPGMFYKKHAENGGDFAEHRALLEHMGYTTVLIPTEEAGTVERNADIISAAIRQHQGQDTIIVSASKGGPEVALALGERLTHTESVHVLAWLNIGGVIYGSPLADDALYGPNSGLMRWLISLQDIDVASVESLTVKVRRAHAAQLTFPTHLKIVNYLGVPLAGDVTSRAGDTYCDLRDIGPNDGLILLPDGVVEGGLTLIELGLDHYFAHPQMKLRTLALLRVFASELGLQTIPHTPTFLEDVQPQTATSKTPCLQPAIDVPNMAFPTL